MKRRQVPKWVWIVAAVVGIGIIASMFVPLVDVVVKISGSEGEDSAE
ncbi:MAG: hypothetical protein ACAH95_11345 [Fimbriimonas sp.]